RGAELENVATRLMGDELTPGWASGLALIAGHHLKVGGPIRIGEHIPTAIPMRRRVEMIGLAPIEEAGACARSARGDEPIFRLAAIAGVDHDPAPALADIHTEKEAIVGFVVDEHVLAAARWAAIDFRRAPIVVAISPEQIS